MAEYTVTVLDTSQIQRYVFSSNRLKENIGASELVMQATRKWAYTHLPSPHNVKQDGELSDERIEDGKLSAEVIYSGGGNTVILFKDLDLACQFTKTLTLQVLRDAPRLQLVVAHREFDWENGEQSLAEIIEEMLARDLARKKQARRPSMPLLGLSVTAACTATGLVAVDVDTDPDNPDEDGQLISREIEIKRSEPIKKAAKKRLNPLLDLSEEEWEIPADFDDLGREKGEESYIAVIHADGNSMGERVREIAEAYSDDNREYILKMREFSQAVRETSTAALQKTAKLLLDAFEHDPDLPKTRTKKDGQFYFPFRPIVFGGDDVTFVCNGKYGLALAVCYLQAFEKETKKQPAFNGKAAHACAGIAVVKTHYPFARAYRLSEALCSSAKKLAKEDDQDRSALDWHFAMSGIAGSLSDIREREYRVQFEGQEKPSHLEMRPVLLEGDEIEWRSWSVMSQLLQKFMKEEWRDKRNKVKALREVLRTGPEAVQEFLRTYRLHDHGLPNANINQNDVTQTGWVGHERCVYFDAIEAMDFYIDLEEVIKGGTNATP